jgi:hypothetical protein
VGIMNNRCLYNVIGAYIVLVLASGNGLRFLCFSGQLARLEPASSA